MNKYDKYRARTLPNQRVRNLRRTRLAAFPHTFGVLSCVDCLEAIPGTPGKFAFTVYRGNALCYPHYMARYRPVRVEYR